MSDKLRERIQQFCDDLKDKVWEIKMVDDITFIDTLNAKNAAIIYAYGVVNERLNKILEETREI